MIEPAAFRALWDEADGNGDLFAWYGPGAPGRGDAVLLGSHFDALAELACR